MWLGYDKPLPERPPIAPKKRKKHIKRRTSLILFGVLFFLFLGVPMLTHWYPNFLWGVAMKILQNHLGLYSVSFIIPFYCGLCSTGFSLGFKFFFSHDPYFVKLYQEMDQRFIRVMTFLIWQEYWDEVYAEGDQG